MPVIACKLSGWVTIQTRGFSVSEEEIERFFIEAHNKELELRPKQFCKHPDGRTVLIDYGRPETVAFLKATK